MASERELKTQQENTLFDVFMLVRLLEEGKTSELKNHLMMLSEKAQSGMSADEIDAVRERVSRTCKARSVF